MGRLWLCFLLLLAVGRGPLNAVNVTTEPSLTVKPRSFVTLAFTIENDSEQEETYDLSLKLPEGWSSISRMGQIKLAPGQKKKKVVSISVPQKASAAKSHQVSLTAQSPTQSAEAHASIKVTAEYGLKLHILQTDAMGWTGETLVHEYAIQNMGNSPERYGIQLKGSLLWSIEAPQHTVTVQPGERLPLNVKIRIPTDAPAGSRNYITLEVWPLSPEANSEKYLKRHRSIVEAIPSKVGREAVYQSLPSTFELKAFDIGARRLPKMRPRLVSSGILDDRYLVDMDLSTTAFREFDDGGAFRSEFYRLDVADPDHWDVSVGDTRADFSYLTRDVFGKGARIRTYGKRWESTWFYGEEDIAADVGLEEAVSAGNVTLFSCDGRYSLGVTYMLTREDARADSPSGTSPHDSDLATIQVTAEPIDHLLVSFEAGYDHVKEANERYDDYAWWLLTTYTPSCWTLEAEAYRSGSHYIAKLHDRQGYRFYAAWRPNEKEFWAEQHNYHNNVDNLPNITREETQRTRLGCYVPEKDCWPSVDSNAEYRKELSLADDQLIDEDTYLLNLTLHKSYAHSTITARGRWDYSQERYTKDHTHLHLYELSCKMNLEIWTLGAGGYLTLSEKTEQSTDNRRLEGWASRPIGAWGTLMGRCALSWRDLEDEGSSYAHRAEVGYYVTKDRWYIDLRARHNFLTGGDLPSDRNQRASQLIGRSIYTIERGNYIEAYLELNDPDAQDKDIRTVVTWKKDFQMPIPFVRTKSVVKGQLLLTDKSLLAELPRRPLSKIRLTLDGTVTYTDADGRFTFPARDPGTYTLDIDRSKLPSSLALETKFPMQIVLHKGETRKINLPVVAVASISGFVFLDPEKTGTRDENAQGLANARIRLIHNGQEIRETFTSYDGQYHFHNLNPGRYTVEIDPIYLPERMEITTATSQEIDLKPKQRLKNTNFGAYERPREVKIKRF